MTPHSPPEPKESEALCRALALFLGDQVEEGRAELDKLRSETLDWVYTVGLRLGIEASILAKRREEAAHNPHILKPSRQ